MLEVFLQSCVFVYIEVVYIALLSSISCKTMREFPHKNWNFEP